MGIDFDLQALGSDLAKALQLVPTREDVCQWILGSIHQAGKEAPTQAAECLTTLALRGRWLPNAATQVSAVTLIARLPTADALPALTRILDESEDEAVRDSVIESLPSVDPEVWTRFLVGKALVLPRPGSRAKAIAKLASNRAFGPDVVRKVLEAAKDPASEVRVAVLEFLRAWNNPEAVVPALGLLRDSDEVVRRWACTTLGMLLGKEAAPELLKALADESEAVRNEAKQALERIRYYHEEKKRWEDWFKGRGTDPGEGIRKLLELLDDPDEPIRVSAIESLGTMKAKEALPRLVETIKKGASKAEREAAAKAVERINRE